MRPDQLRAVEQNGSNWSFCDGLPAGTGHESGWRSVTTTSFKSPNAVSRPTGRKIDKNASHVPMAIPGFPETGRFTSEVAGNHTAGCSAFASTYERRGPAPGFERENSRKHNYELGFAAAQQSYETMNDLDAGRHPRDQRHAKHGDQNTKDVRDKVHWRDPTNRGNTYNPIRPQFNVPNSLKPLPRRRDGGTGGRSMPSSGGGGTYWSQPTNDVPQRRQNRPGYTYHLIKGKMEPNKVRPPDKNLAVKPPLRTLVAVRPPNGEVIGHDTHDKWAPRTSAQHAFGGAVR